jgi:hypothetical protein
LPYNPTKEKKRERKREKKKKTRPALPTYSFCQNFLSKFSIPARYGGVPNVENLR